MAVLFMVALLPVANWLRPAAAQLLGPEFQVNSYTTGDQTAPAVAAGGSQFFIVVWQSDGQDGSSNGVFGQRFDSAGIPIGNEFRVNSFTTGSQFGPAVAVGDSGNFVVVWNSNGQDGSDRGVFGQRFDSAGAPVGSEFQVNSFTAGVQQRPAVTADDTGFLVIWESSGQDGSSYGVFGRRFDSEGVPDGSEFPINMYTMNNQSQPAVARNGPSRFVVVWQSLGQDGSDRGVFGQRIDSAGNSAGTELQINSYTSRAQYGPAVAADGSGNFVVVWPSYLQDGSPWGVFGRRFDPGGVPLGSEFQVNSFTTGDQFAPAVAADGRGHLVVVWDSYDQDGSFSGVFGQRFNSSGLPVGSEFQVNSYATSSQWYPAVTADVPGHFVLVWPSYGQDGSNFGVFARRMWISIFSDGFESGDACGWSVVVGGGGCS